MSVEQKIAELLEKANQVVESDDEFVLTLEDLELMTEDEISTLIENIDQLDEVSAATLAQYVAKAPGMGADLDGGPATSKVRAKLNNGEKTTMLDKVSDKAEMETTEIVDASSKEKGDKTKEQDVDGKVDKAATRMKVESIDLGSLFEGEEFSTEFVAKATEIFEAAVAARVAQEVEQIKEELDTQSLTESAEFKQGLAEKVDGYIGYVAEKWLSDNEVALDRGIKSDIFESFVSGMRTLFVEHNINVPEDKFDMLEAAQSEIEELKGQIGSLTEDNVAKTNTLKEVAKRLMIEEATEGLTDVQAEKFTRLAEELVYENDESFEGKLKLIRENYFKPETKGTTTITESFITDEPVITEEKEQTKLTPEMAKYVRALK